MKDIGQLSLFPGIEVTQERYIEKLLKRFGLQDAKPLQYPCDQNTKLIIFDTEKPGELMTNRTVYRELIGSLMYLMVCTRPDIAFIVSVLARFMAIPEKKHFAVAKNVLRYLKGTKTRGITYKPTKCTLPKKESLDIAGYTDADWAGDTKTRKSTSGYLFMLQGSHVISWKSKQQESVATSSTEAEYISLHEGLKEGIWLKNLLMDFGINIPMITLFEDNQACCRLTSQNLITSRTKHVDVRYHSIRDHVKNKTVKVIWIPTTEMIADILTKFCTGPKFIELRNQIVKTPSTTTESADISIEGGCKEDISIDNAIIHLLGQYERYTGLLLLA
jgi:hypothetical protein